ncbi:amine sulfotransferase-like isoform X1 [Manis javanica]|uniref:amine sulfotransferase-like isoform X1 n=1 Tax=Manis javanica TaxID=9974 RepID=UPI003C6CD37E
MQTSCPGVSAFATHHTVGSCSRTSGKGLVWLEKEFQMILSTFVIVYGSWFDHVLSWEEHKHDKNILTMFYEKMKKDLSKSIKKITTFLNINMSDDEIDKIAWKTSFSEMKNNAAKENSDSNHTICALTCNRNLVFRKGAVGDWINYFTSKQKRVFDELFSEKMKHSELARHFEDSSI